MTKIYTVQEIIVESDNLRELAGIQDLETITMAFRPSSVYRSLDEAKRAVVKDCNVERAEYNADEDDPKYRIPLVSDGHEFEIYERSSYLYDDHMEILYVVTELDLAD